MRKDFSIILLLYLPTVFLIYLWSSVPEKDTLFPVYLYLVCRAYILRVQGIYTLRAGHIYPACRTYILNTLGIYIQQTVDSYSLREAWKKALRCVKSLNKGLSYRVIFMPCAFPLFYL